MYFTRQTEIAINILSNCASKPGYLYTTREMARQIGITKDYAAKTVALLVRHGLLRSERGKIGGISLAVDPGTITLRSILRATQPAHTMSFRERGKPVLADNETFMMLVDAVSRNFAELTERYTVAEFSAYQHPGQQSAAMH